MLTMSTTELFTTFTNVLKTTTLIQDIASYMIDPRPWLIVFGEALSYEEHEDLSLHHLTKLHDFVKSKIISEKEKVLEMKEDYSVILKLSEDFINAFDPSDVFQQDFTEHQTTFDNIEMLYMKCYNFVNYFTFGSSRCPKYVTGTYRDIVYHKFPYQYITRNHRNMI